MKKVIICFLLIAATLFSFTACAAGEGNDGGINMSPTYDYYEGYKYTMENGSLDTWVEIPKEDYGKFVENPFINTSEENVSTFSADVDTASYSYFRKLVGQGYSLSELISTARGSIRTEELINYFDYSYSEPKDGELFSVTAQMAPCPWNPEAELLIMGLKADEIQTAPRNNLVFLIDVSGSMNSSDKLGLLKTSFSYLVSNLGEDDTISIVTYSGREDVVLEGCSGAKHDKIMNAVDDLKASGSTNGEAGLRMAYRLAEEYYIPGGNNRIILASDGDLNVGISSASELEKFVSEKKESGVFLSVLGFGTGNYKDSNMETIADCGNGVYYYIDGEAEAERVMGEKIFSTLYTIAKDVKLQLTFDTQAVSSYRLVGYENRLLDKEDFENDTKDAGELGAGHSVTVCYEVIMKNGAEKDHLMDLAVRYKEPDGEKSKLEEYVIDSSICTDRPNDDFKFIAALIETSMIIRESKYMEGVTLADIKEELGSLDLSRDRYKAQFASLIDKLIENGKR